MALIEKPSLFGVALQGRRYSLGKRDALWHKKRTSARVDFRAVQRVRQQGPVHKRTLTKDLYFKSHRLYMYTNVSARKLALF